MNIKIGVLLIFILFFSQETILGQVKVGVEFGTILSTTHSSSREYIAKPKISTRGGFNFLYQVNPLFSIRSGIFYASRGDAYHRPLHTLNVPVMAQYHPIPQLSFGLGLETNVFVRFDTPTNYYPLTLGARAEINWHISSKIQLTAHFAHDLTSHYKAYGVYDTYSQSLKAYSEPIQNYNVSAGLSLAYYFFEN
jgi:hypothetical protein